MSDLIALELKGVSKMYKMYANRRDRVLEAVGLGFLMRAKPSEFWSLRDVDLVVPRGRRVGIIGRNGAGKSTLLKLITGNIAVTEGELTVNGQVQALLEAGAGFHPEFTGAENIRAALTYQNMSREEIAKAVEEIAEFTELEQFLDQPIKSYSLGMVARLAFATATAVKPDILIIDEVLGAGDAYFLNKSSERMRAIVESTGATVLLVSHSLDQVLRYCEEAIWLDRGRIVQRGPAIDVVNAYQAFVLDLEERRLQGKNRRRTQIQDTNPAIEVGDEMRVLFDWTSERRGGCDFSEVRLIRDGLTVDSITVGDVQDSNTDHTSAVILKQRQWSDPKREGRQFYRALELRKSDVAVGEICFRRPGSLDPGDYAVAIRHRPHAAGSMKVKTTLNALTVGETVVTATGADWRESMVTLGRLPSAASESAVVATSPSTEVDALGVVRPRIRWPGEGSLSIVDITITDERDQPKTIFKAGSSLRLSFSVRANRDGHFDLVSGLSLFRLDGIFVSNLISRETPLDLKNGEHQRIHVDLAPVSLGDGFYVFSISIFEKSVTVESRYDLVARCIEFKVIDNEPLHANAIFQHPMSWKLDPPLR